MKQLKRSLQSILKGLKALTEKTEKLEQLRALYRGDKIYCPDAVSAPGIGIDTPDDIERARARWNKN